MGKYYSLKNIFDDIKTFNDIQNLITDTEDGESATLEFKSIHENSFTGKEIGKTKAILAKEICAFLNTNDGLIIWGAEVDKEKHALTIKNDSTENLADFLDKNLRDMIEPFPSGIEYKSLSDNNDTCLVLYIPKSNLAPHRVGSWDVEEDQKGRKKIINKYFQRIGTNSVAMPENIIRAMYLSKGRIPNITTYTEISNISHNEIELTTRVNPDSSLFINQYFNKNQVAILDSNFKIITDENDTIWKDIGHYTGPIYPNDKSYQLYTSYIINYIENNYVGSNSEERIIEQIPHVFNKNSIILKNGQFPKINAIATKSSFACDGVSLKEQKILYILYSISTWLFPDYTLNKSSFMKDLEKEFDFEIYISKSFNTYIGEENDKSKLSSVGQTELIKIKEALRILNLK